MFSAVVKGPNHIEQFILRYETAHKSRSRFGIGVVNECGDDVRIIGAQELLAKIGVPAEFPVNGNTALSPDRGR